MNSEPFIATEMRKHQFNKKTGTNNILDAFLFMDPPSKVIRIRERFSAPSTIFLISALIKALLFIAVIKKHRCEALITRHRWLNVHQSSDTQGEHLSTCVGSFSWLSGCFQAVARRRVFLRSHSCVLLSFTHTSARAHRRQEEQQFSYRKSSSDPPPTPDFQSSRVIFCSAVASKTHKRPAAGAMVAHKHTQTKKTCCHTTINGAEKARILLFKSGKGKKITSGITTSPLIRYLG